MPEKRQFFRLFKKDWLVNLQKLFFHACLYKGAYGFFPCLAQIEAEICDKRFYMLPRYFFIHFLGILSDKFC